jgi:hypothetical protein
MSDNTPIYQFTFSTPTEGCRWCSNAINQVVHSGKCPKVKRLVYDKRGLIQEVEFWPETPDE